MAHETSFAVLAALALAVGCSKPTDDGKGSGVGAPSSSGESATTYAVMVDGKGFTPSSVEVKKGSRTSLTFTRTTDETCAKAVVFPELRLTRELPLNKPTVIDVPTETARTLTFQCGMGMYKSSVVIN